MSKKNADKKVVSPKSLDDAFLSCRTFGHVWAREPGRVAEIGIELDLRCGSCLTKRLDSVSYNGAVIVRSYEYPEGYKMEAGYVRSDFRGEIIRRHL